MPIPDPQDPHRLQGIKITEIFSSVALKRNLYLEKETISRVNLTFTRTNSTGFQMTLNSGQTQDT